MPAGKAPDEEFPDENFALDPNCKDEPVVLEATFVSEGVRYELAITLSRKRVLQERFVAYPEGRAQVWYDREWSEESGRYEWSPANPVEFRRDPGIVEKTRPNALFLSTAAQWNNESVMPVYRWFSDRLKFLHLGANGRLDHEFTPKVVNHSPENRRRVASLLRPADVGLVDVEARDAEIDLLFAWGGRLWLVDCKDCKPAESLADALHRGLPQLPTDLNRLLGRIREELEIGQTKALKEDLIAVREAGGLLGNVVCVRRADLPLSIPTSRTPRQSLPCPSSLARLC